jgi:hypothetical protein
VRGRPTAWARRTETCRRTRVHVNDLHATLLHLLGLEHTRLTYRFNGRDFRLTDVGDEVPREILV